MLACGFAPMRFRLSGKVGTTGFLIERSADSLRTFFAYVTEKQRGVTDWFGLTTKQEPTVSSTAQSVPLKPNARNRAAHYSKTAFENYCSRRNWGKHSCPGGGAYARNCTARRKGQRRGGRSSRHFI